MSVSGDSSTWAHTRCGRHRSVDATTSRSTATEVPLLSKRVGPGSVVVVELVEVILVVVQSNVASGSLEISISRFTIDI